MKRTEYAKREKKWRAYHQLENSVKHGLFRNMTERDSLKILEGLHEFAAKSGIRAYSGKPDPDKIKTLSRIHSIFGKVKT